MIKEKLLTINKYSRPNKKLKKVSGIVVNYTANNGASAIANINFFENRKNGKDGFGSAHYFTDLNGDVYRCVPEDEITYNCGGSEYVKETLEILQTTYPNDCTIGIEMCVNKDGKFNKETYDKTVLLVTYLLKKYDLYDVKYLFRHYDVTRKICPAPLININEWNKFKKDVDNCLLKYKDKFSKDIESLL